ncbi:HAMP domain-containing sensor histidine kinase [Oryzisolibacter sp. LB2S]|uniref:sensor histidine kinase n=1 Tax=Alicycliphilus soli TaxID=3228789 RepID=UPI00345B0006
MTANTLPSTHANRQPFQRLWHTFLTARVLVAQALVLLQLLAMALNQSRDLVMLGVALGYLLATALVRIFDARLPPDPRPGIQWLPTIGLDIAAIALLQTLAQTGSMNFTALFGLPILMAGVLGTLTLALGTTACVTLLLLALAWWLGQHGGGDAAQRYLQTGLTGTGYFLVAYLVNQLATRITREQQVARRSQMDARTQMAVSALVMQHVADGVLVLDGKGLVRLANPAALLLLGPDARTAMPFMLAHTEAWKPLMRLAQATFEQAQPQHCDVNILHEGHPPMGLRVRTRLTHAPDAARGADVESLCVMFLHDLREMEARLRAEKLASMGRMSAAVAHEIRNPLTAIVQANELLAEDLRDPGHQRLSHMIAQNAERLVRITEDVLDIARVQHQIDQGPSATLTLDACVTQIWQDWQAQDPARRQGLLLLEAGTAQVAFDAEHLRRVLVNLLDNALRYKGPHEDSLLLSTRATEGAPVHLQIWSDGEPLDKSVERHLFEPFFSSESRSSGLGLYICRQLCQRHGASIGYQRATRMLGRGAVAGNAFTVSFRGTTRPAETNSLFDTLVV